MMEFSEEQNNLISNSENAKKKTGTSPIGIYLTFVNGFVGGGLLGLPYGFLNGGLIASVVGLIIISLLSNYTLRLIIACKTEYFKSPQGLRSLNDDSSDGKEPQTYADIGKLCFGKSGVIMVNASILVSQLGYCCAYLVFIAKNITTLSFFDSLHLTDIEVLLAVLPILVWLTWIRDLKYLSYGSLISNFAIVSTIIAVIQYGFSHEGVQPVSHYPLAHLDTFPIFYGIVAFSFTIHGLVLDIHKSAENPAKFHMSMDSAMLFVTIAYVAFGLLGYMFFGEDTNSVITMNLAVNVESDVIKIALSLILIFAYPLQMYPAVKIMEGGLFPEPNPRLSDTMKRNFFRLVVIVLTGVAAVAVPLFGLFAALVGTFSNSFIAFIYPPVFYLKLFNTSTSVLNKVLCGIVFVFGLIGMGVGSTITVIKIVKSL